MNRQLTLSAAARNVNFVFFLIANPLENIDPRYSHPPCFAEQNVSSLRAEDFPPCFAEQNASPLRAEDFPPYSDCLLMSGSFFCYNCMYSQSYGALSEFAPIISVFSPCVNRQFYRKQKAGSPACYTGLRSPPSVIISFLQETTVRCNHILPCRIFLNDR